MQHNIPFPCRPSYVVSTGRVQESALAGVGRVGARGVDSGVHRQVGYSVWYGKREPRNFAAHVPPHERQSISRGKLRGYCMHCCIAEQHGWWWCLTQSMFLKQLRSGRRASGSLDGAYPEGREAIEISRNRSCGYENKQVNRCNYGRCPRTWMSRAMNTRMSSRPRVVCSIRIVCCRCQNGSG